MNCSRVALLNLILSVTGCRFACRVLGSTKAVLPDACSDGMKDQKHRSRGRAETITSPAPLWRSQRSDMLDDTSMSGGNATRLGRVALALVVAGLVLPVSDSRAAHGPPLTTRRGAVASDHGIASEVGARVLAEGG